MHRPLPSAAMSPSRLWPALAVLLPAVSSLLAPMSTVDLTYQLRAGRLMLDTRALLTVDSFTFTVAGQPWLDQQWLAQLVLAGSHELGSWAGLALLRAVLIGVIAAGVLIACRAGGLGPRTASLLALLAYVVALPALALRPQLLGIACFAVVLALLAVRRDRRAVVWLVVPVAVLWANVHGSFLLAPAAVGFALLTDLAARRGGLRRLFVLLMATVVATCITPWGPSVWTYAIDLARDPRLRELVTEWQPPELLSFVGIALAVSGFLAILIVVRAGRRSDWPTVIWLLGLAVLAAMTQRGIPWWAVGAPVALAPILARIIPASSSAGASASATGGRVDRIFGIAIPGIVTLAGLVMLVPWIGADPVLGPPGKLTDAPPGVTAAILAQGRPGRSAVRRPALGLMVRVGRAREAGLRRQPGRAVPAAGLGRVPCGQPRRHRLAGDPRPLGRRHRRRLEDRAGGPRPGDLRGSWLARRVRHAGWAGRRPPLTRGVADAARRRRTAPGVDAMHRASSRGTSRRASGRSTIRASPADGGEIRANVSTLLRTTAVTDAVSGHRLVAAPLRRVSAPRLMRALRLLTATWFLTILVFTPLSRATFLLDPGVIGNDVSNYYAAGQRLNAGHELYRLVPGDRPVPFYPPYVTVPLISPPPIAVLWRGLELLPEQIAIRAWWLGGLVLMTTAVLWVIRRGSLLALAIVATQALDLAWTAWSGNVNAYIIPALVAAWAWHLRRPLLAGVLAGLATAARLTPILLAWWGVVGGRSRFVAAMAVTLLMVLATSLLGAGIQNHLTWLEVARHTASTGASEGSLVLLLTSTGLDPSIAAAVVPAMVIVGIAAVYLFRDRPALGWSAAILAAAIASPVVHNGSWAALLAVAAATIAPFPALGRDETAATSGGLDRPLTPAPAGAAAE